MAGVDKISVVKRFGKNVRVLNLTAPACYKEESSFDNFDCLGFFDLLPSILASSNIVFYNLTHENLVLMVLSRIFGKKVIVMVEDLGLFGLRPIRDFLLLIGVRKVSIVDRRLLIDPRFFFNISHLVRAANYLDYLGRTTSTNNDIFFGGSLIDDNGLKIFLDSISLFKSRSDVIPLRFRISGFVGEKYFPVELSKLSNEANLLFEGNLNANEFVGLVSNCRIAVVLRDPDSPLKDTTFPSKFWLHLCLNEHVVTNLDFDDRDIVGFENRVVKIGFDAVELMEGIRSVLSSVSKISEGDNSIVRHRIKSNVREFCDFCCG